MNRLHLPEPASSLPSSLTVHVCLCHVLVPSLLLGVRSFHPMIESEGKTEQELQELVRAAIVSKLPPSHLPDEPEEANAVKEMAVSPS